MVKILLFICLLLLNSCSCIYGGDDQPPPEPFHYSGNIETRTHKPLLFEFEWQDDSLVKAGVFVKYVESVENSSNCPNCEDSLGCSCYVKGARYALESKVVGEDSLFTTRGSEIDSLVVKLFHSIDSTQHLKFSLKDSANAVKSYNLDLTPLISYANSPMHYEIRGDSIDIFLPEGNFYVLYIGSCYNGIDDFDEFNDMCWVYKTSKDSQTITLEVAAFTHLFYEVHFDFDEENNTEGDFFTFKWKYSNVF
ncbi:hypothetical protein [Fibrobacter intestinalis]|uniref:Lipoprotein n=1 Tax=Fibrobacter intestinalis TaxID=28122 RepID=A0A1T4MXS3_9BACT|nr:MULTISPECIES: hypothetical protein [Fibrobacter]PBC75151.1 hypothetical protein BGW94_2834 [Fibrobacter sp. NR9]SJZ71644.1 hypothetical protein SAMN02745108_01413 [Fibrobacter intestinalis]